MQNGEQGTVIAAGGDMVQIEYRAGKQAYSDRQTLQFGLFPVQTRQASFPPDVIGVRSQSETSLRYSGRMPRVKPGSTWQIRVRNVSVTDDHSGRGIRGRIDADTVDSFPEAKEVTLGGCANRMVPVEAGTTANGLSHSFRTAYFPDPGFGIETQLTDYQSRTVSSNGTTAMWPVR